MSIMCFILVCLCVWRCIVSLKELCNTSPRCIVRKLKQRAEAACQHMWSIGARRSNQTPGSTDDLQHSQLTRLPRWSWRRPRVGGRDDFDEPGGLNQGLMKECQRTVLQGMKTYPGTVDNPCTFWGEWWHPTKQEQVEKG